MLLDITKTKQEIYYQQLKKLVNSLSHNRLVGFWGQPDQQTMDLLVKNNYQFIDLDIPQFDFEPNYIPTTTCHIVQDIFANAYTLKNQSSLSKPSIFNPKNMIIMPLVFLNKIWFLNNNFPTALAERPKRIKIKENPEINAKALSKTFIFKRLFFSTDNWFVETPVI